MDEEDEGERREKWFGRLKLFNTSSNAASQRGASDTTIWEMGGGVCLYWPNKPPICGEKNGGCGKQGGATALHVYTPFKRTERSSVLPRGSLMLVDTAAWWCHTAESEGGRYDQRGEGGMKTQERISKTTTGQRWRLLLQWDVQWHPDLCIARRNAGGALSAFPLALAGCPPAPGTIKPTSTIALLAR